MEEFLRKELRPPVHSASASADRATPSPSPSDVFPSVEERLPKPEAANPEGALFRRRSQRPANPETRCRRLERSEERRRCWGDVPLAGATVGGGDCGSTSVEDWQVRSSSPEVRSMLVRRVGALGGWLMLIMLGSGKTRWSSRGLGGTSAMRTLLLDGSGFTTRKSDCRN